MNHGNYDLSSRPIFVSKFETSSLWPQTMELVSHVRRFKHQSENKCLRGYQMVHTSTIPSPTRFVFLFLLNRTHSITIHHPRMSKYISVIQSSHPHASHSTSIGGQTFQHLTVIHFGVRFPSHWWHSLELSYVTLFSPPASTHPEYKSLVSQCTR